MLVPEAKCAPINEWVASKNNMKWIAMFFDHQQEVAAIKPIDGPVKVG